MILFRLAFDSRCALMSPPVDPVGQLIPPPHGGSTMRATEWAVNGLAGSSDHPSGLISVKPVCALRLCGRSGPGALVGLKRIGSVGHDHGRPCSPARVAERSGSAATPSNARWRPLEPEVRRPNVMRDRRATLVLHVAALQTSVRGRGARRINPTGSAPRREVLAGLGNFQVRLEVESCLAP